MASFRGLIQPWAPHEPSCFGFVGEERVTSPKTSAQEASDFPTADLGERGQWERDWFSLGAAREGPQVLASEASR